MKLFVKTVRAYGRFREFFSGFSPAEIRAVPQVNSCGIFGGERGTEAGCSSSALVYAG